ncbi:hypothetical protein [Desulfolutivibrio sulfoxidireducens]|uniref:hypothetical protein n=1 Tax=Desulfolutivibrio sulfoxidireducens TaxID=2773299 RepID=UPI00159E341D|nr:hypothetical protein [Desulfolutivibrio sulfoxidireducens]QLA17831.1 hypothetical protein GD605_17965 [Desulfolutivibrio sulfoxidireducens]QLA21409.1 hypothetical protein GD604_17585 [Desulfolutivibrio sulfoxidireducens]
MEKVLLRMARQLAAFDEASLMSLWQAYAERVNRFEPSKRWEEAVLVLGMIQAMRFKNQLFNHHWAAAAAPGATTAGGEQGTRREDGLRPVPSQAPADAGKRGKLLTLRPKEDGEA